MIRHGNTTVPLSDNRPEDVPQIAILIPCYNEEVTIGRVVRDFRTELPQATIYVFDNNSSDATAEVARQAGAVVIPERRQGKGYVVQSMFRKVEADVYVLVDGDDTYPASAVHGLIAPVLEDEADMVVGSRLHAQSKSCFKRLNLLGNKLFLFVLNRTFGMRLTDLLSGYRAFSRTFTKTVALGGGGFEVETELTIKAMECGFRIAEVPIDLTARPEGSFSKIRPFHDGVRIFNTIFALFRDYKPLTFFGVLAILMVTAGMIPGLVVVLEFLETGAVYRIPSAILATALVLMGMLMLTSGVILHSMTRRIRELQYYLRSIANRESGEATAPRQRTAA